MFQDLLKDGCADQDFKLPGAKVEYDGVTLSSSVQEKRNEVQILSKRPKVDSDNKSQYSLEEDQDVSGFLDIFSEEDIPDEIDDFTPLQMISQTYNSKIQLEKTNKLKDKSSLLTSQLLSYRNVKNPLQNSLIVSYPQSVPIHREVDAKASLQELENSKVMSTIEYVANQHYSRTTGNSQYQSYLNEVATGLRVATKIRELCGQSDEFTIRDCHNHQKRIVLLDLDETLIRAEPFKVD